MRRPSCLIALGFESRADIWEKVGVIVGILFGVAGKLLLSGELIESFLLLKAHGLRRTHSRPLCNNSEGVTQQTAASVLIVIHRRKRAALLGNAEAMCTGEGSYLHRSSSRLVCS